MFVTLFSSVEAPENPENHIAISSTHSYLEDRLFAMIFGPYGLLPREFQVGTTFFHPFLAVDRLLAPPWQSKFFGCHLVQPIPYSTLKVYLSNTVLATIEKNNPKIAFQVDH
jgi:hypothetical protein